MAIYLAIWAWFCGLIAPARKGDASRQFRRGEKLVGKMEQECWVPAGGTGAAPPPSPWCKSGHNLILAFFLAAAWTTTEWLRSWIFSGWGWNGLGVALHDNWIIIQVAEYTGVFGLSFVVAFANVIALTTVRRVILEARFRSMRPHWDINFTMLGVVGLILFGWHAARAPRVLKPFRVAAVQAGIPRAEKFDRPVHRENLRAI